jgi:hypothetical protein
MNPAYQQTRTKQELTDDLPSTPSTVLGAFPLLRRCPADWELEWRFSHAQIVFSHRSRDRCGTSSHRDQFDAGKRRPILRNLCRRPKLPEL